MSGARDYFVYIMANQSRTLYVGVTNNIRRRVRQHNDGEAPGFTSKYKTTCLVYVERFANINSAIAREKQIKGWRRDKKVLLIQKENPDWNDLAEFL